MGYVSYSIGLHHRVTSHIFALLHFALFILHFAQCFGNWMAAGQKKITHRFFVRFAYFFLHHPCSAQQLSFGEKNCYQHFHRHFFWHFSAMLWYLPLPPEKFVTPGMWFGWKELLSGALRQPKIPPSPQSLVFSGIFSMNARSCQTYVNKKSGVFDRPTLSYNLSRWRDVEWLFQLGFEGMVRKARDRY